MAAIHYSYMVDYYKLEYYGVSVIITSCQVYKHSDHYHSSYITCSYEGATHAELSTE